MFDRRMNQQYKPAEKQVRQESQQIQEVNQKPQELMEIPKGAWGSENVDSKDLILPSIHLMQGLSQFVKDNKIRARMGEFRGSLTGELLGGEDQPVLFIPFYFFKTWLEYELINNEEQFLKKEFVTPENANLPKEYRIGEQFYVRRPCINVYCLLPQDIESGQCIPYNISFRKTSYGAGRKLSTFFSILQGAKQPEPPASRVYELHSQLREGEKGPYYVMDVSESQRSTTKQMLSAYQWYKTVQMRNVVVDEGDASEAIPF